MRAFLNGGIPEWNMLFTDFNDIPRFIYIALGPNFFIHYGPYFIDTKNTFQIKRIRNRNFFATLFRSKVSEIVICLKLQELCMIGFIQLIVHELIAVTKT